MSGGVTRSAGVRAARLAKRSHSFFDTPNGQCYHPAHPSPGERLLMGKPLAVHTDVRGERLVEALEGKLLRDAGFDLGGSRCRSEDEVVELARGADVVLNGLVPLTRRVLDGLPICRIVARYGVGVDNVDLEAATDNGIAVVHVPDFCTEEVSNHALTFLLVWAKQLIPLNDSIHAGGWDQKPSANVRSVHQQTLGIVGAGRLGMATARKGQALSMEVLVCDPYLDDEAVRGEGFPEGGPGYPPGGQRLCVASHPFDLGDPSPYWPGTAQDYEGERIPD